MQLLTIESAGTAAETALLADVKAQNADTTATELLRLFQVRCVADGLWLCARCVVCADGTGLSGTEAKWERAKWDQSQVRTGSRRALGGCAVRCVVCAGGNGLSGTEAKWERAKWDQG